MSAEKPIPKEVDALVHAALDVLDIELTEAQRTTADEIYELANALEVSYMPEEEPDDNDNEEEEEEPI